jgi:hypothetical protein
VIRLAFAALAASLLACAPASGGDRCPGTRLAVLDFVGARLDPGQPLPPEIPPDLPPTGCAGGTPSGGFAVSKDIGFQATVAADPAGTGAALCKPDKEATPLVGTRSGDVIDVSLTSSGAVLDAQCDPRCAVVITEVVHGTLAPNPATGAQGFRGYLWDRAVAASPSTACGACVLPCDAVYLLTGTAAAAH